MPHIAVKREFGGKKRGAQLRNELLGRIGRLPETSPLGPDQAAPCALPTPQLAAYLITASAALLTNSTRRARSICLLFVCSCLRRALAQSAGGAGGQNRLASAAQWGCANFVSKSTNR